jgi:hypothetical protein
LNIRRRFGFVFCRNDSDVGAYFPREFFEPPIVNIKQLAIRELRPAKNRHIVATLLNPKRIEFSFRSSCSY